MQPLGFVFRKLFVIFAQEIFVQMGAIQLVLLENSRDFIKSIPPQARKKLMYNVWRIVGGEKNSDIFKKLENSKIWEFRASIGGIAYRLFAFWDTETDTLIVATHGIVKKTQKTPSNEISKAEAIMKRYFELKRG